jgi:hypothetical protein
MYEKMNNNQVPFRPTIYAFLSARNAIVVVIVVAGDGESIKD